MTTAHEYQRRAGRRAICLMLVLIVVVAVVLLAVRILLLDGCSHHMLTLPCLCRSFHSVCASHGSVVWGPRTLTTMHYELSIPYVLSRLARNTLLAVLTRRLDSLLKLSCVGRTSKRAVLDLWFVSVGVKPFEPCAGPGPCFSYSPQCLSGGNGPPTGLP